MTEKFLECFDDHRRFFQPLLMCILPQCFRKVCGQAKLFPNCTATSIGFPVFRIFGFLTFRMYGFVCFRVSVVMILLAH